MQKVIFHGKYILQDLELRREKGAEAIFKGKNVKSIFLKKSLWPFFSLFFIFDKILAITKDEEYLQNLAKQSKVKECERQIDQMVYNLYNLTDEEIKIVEQFGAKGR